MTRSKLRNYLLSFALLAFLAMQWGNLHAHANHHDNDHQLSAHTHFSLGHHADAIDSAQPAHDHSVVDLEKDAFLPKGKKHAEQNLAAYLPGTLTLALHNLKQRIDLPSPTVSYNQLKHPPQQSRAPPSIV
ncbi:MAG: hypothetical protein OEW58_10935 [Gammaproteobacteria bacterium]|nr:hypothetical protein [Gammaproteobacteria bacterium]